MKYAVNQQGVLALKTMSAAIIDSIESIQGLTKALRSSAEEHSNTLGPHISSINNVIEEIDRQTKEATEPATGVSESLNEVAEGYQEVIDNDRINGLSGK